MVSKKKKSNPLDAHRKAARARELKKNREQREATREVTLVRKDTRGIEREIRSLQEKRGRSEADNGELSRLQSELQRVQEAKEEYLAKHPDHRKFVYPREQEERVEEAKREVAASEQRKRQPQRDPRRSVYYDEVYNPHGAPPPGMPYMEKSAEQWEAEQRREFDSMAGEASGEDSGSDEEGSDEEEEEEDIMLPQGPPPPQQQKKEESEAEEEEEESADEDGIVMPKGPPPGPPLAPKAMQQGIPTGPSAVHRPPPLPPTHFRPPLPPPPPSFQAGQMPHHARPMYHPQRPAWSATSRPHPTPPSSFPRPPLGPPPSPGPPPPPPPTVITSAPVMRDLKKEATAFVPTALRKKQAAQKARAATGGLPTAVNAAPNAGVSAPLPGHQPPSRSGEAEGEDGLDERVGLMDTLKPHFAKQAGQGSTDDYKKFLGEMNDLL